MDQAERRMKQKFIEDYYRSQQPVPAELPATEKERAGARIGSQGYLRGEYGQQQGLKWPGSAQAHADSLITDAIPSREQSRLGSKVSIPDSVAYYGNRMGDSTLPAADRFGAKGKFEDYKGLQRDIDPVKGRLADIAEAEDDLSSRDPAVREKARNYLATEGESADLRAKSPTPPKETKVDLPTARNKYSTALAKLNKLRSTPVMTPEMFEGLMKDNPFAALVFAEKGVTSSKQVDKETMEALDAALQNEVDNWKKYIDDEEYNEKVTVGENGMIDIKGLLDE